MLQFFRQIAHPKNSLLFPSRNSHLLSQYFKRGFAKVSKTEKLPFEKFHEIRDFQRVVYRKLEEHNKVYAENAALFLKSGEMEPALLEEARVKMAAVEQQHTVFEQYHNILTSLEELKKMKNETPPKDMETHELLDEEIESSEELLQEAEEKAIELLVPPDKYDDCNLINIEIRPGVGGSESSLFADDILQMYQAYLPTRGFNCQMVSYQTDTQIGKGCKFGHLRVTGPNAYKQMKCESGVHKVIRVPETEKLGRLQSSTISVVVLPDIPLNFKVDEKDLKIEYMRASGAGGQHVNKTESACRVTHIPTGLAVFIQDDRTQHTNRAKALAILKERLFAIEVAKNQEGLHSQRKEQMASGDRSDKIRTYNFPQSRITDHRTNLTLFGIEKMLLGELLDEFIDEYLKKVYQGKISMLLEEDQ